MIMAIDYKERCEQYERFLGINGHDPVNNAFFVFVKMLNQQTEYLSNFDLKSHITKADSKDEPQYKRAMDMIDGLPKMITAVNDLRSVLKLSREDIEGIDKVKPLFSRITTPENIADSIGNLAGKTKT